VEVKTKYAASYFERWRCRLIFLRGR